MKNQQQVIEEYQKNGVSFISALFDQQQMTRLNSEIQRLMDERVSGTVFEDDNKTVRGLHGCHLHSDYIEQLTRQPQLLALVEQILQSKVYVHQLKVNVKQAFVGEKWEWHQDFIFWQREDGIKQPKLVNVMLALDDVNEFNGPLFIIPGSQQHGVIEEGQGLVVYNRDSNNWQESFKEKLKYTIDESTVKHLADDNGMVMGKCDAGQMMLFNSNVVHASSPNISPYNRRILIITYNAIDNQSVFSKLKRPEYIASRAVEPLSPYADKPGG